MGLFGRSKNSLETRVDELERKVRTLEMDWSDVLDKILHRLQRQSKRDQREIQSLSQPPTATIATPAAPDGGYSRKAALYAKARGLLRGQNGDSRQVGVSPPGQTPTG
jgi:hypothetical protein